MFLKLAPETGSPRPTLLRRVLRALALTGAHLRPGLPAELVPSAADRRGMNR